jgi:hypothetical protein
LSDAHITSVDTEPALTAAARFAASVADLRAYVDGCQLSVEGQRYGSGADARAFGERYEPWAEDTLSAMEALLLRLRDTGTNTGHAIQRSEMTDEDNAADLNSVGGEPA